MYSATDSTVATQKTLMGTFHRMWRVMVVVFCYWLLQWGSADLMSAFFRSAVVCPAPTLVGGECPTGSKKTPEGTCTAMPKSSRDWSGSAHCADKDYVVSRATAAHGKVSSLGYLGMIFSQVFVGAAMLDTLGRKPVMLMGMASSTVLCAVLWFSCHVASDLVISVVATGFIISKLSDSFVAASTAMISDLAKGDRQWQGLGFAAVNVLRHTGIVLAFSGGFPVLSMYLEDYTMVWGLMLMLGCAATTVSAVVLRETISGGMASAASALAGSEPPAARLPEQLEGGGGGGGGGSGGAGAGKEPRSIQMVNVMAETGAAFRAAWADRVLCGLMALCFLCTSAAYGTISVMGGFGLEVAKLRQQVVSLAGVVQPVAVVLGSLAAADLLDKMGEMGTYLLGISVLIFGLLATGSGAHFHSCSAACFWVGVFCCGVGFGLIEPAFWKLVSLRAQKQNYGKVFSVKMFMETMGQAFGSYVWSNYLFDNIGSGTWMAGLGMFVSAGVLVGVFWGAVFLHCTHLR